MAQSVKRLTRDFSSGRDLTVHESEPGVGSVPTTRSLLGILSVSLCPSPAVRMCSLSLSLSTNNFLKEREKVEKGAPFICSLPPSPTPQARGVEQPVIKLQPPASRDPVPDWNSP